MKDVHTEHCCIVHGCKYGKDDVCTVTTKTAPQSHPCESCEGAMPFSVDWYANELRYVSPETRQVLWAAMWAMAKDVHAPQDNLTPEQWNHAEVVLNALDKLANEPETTEEELPFVPEDHPSCAVCGECMACNLRPCRDGGEHRP